MSKRRTVILKHSNVQGKIPTVQALEYGELAVNSTAGATFLSTKDSSSAVTTFDNTTNYGHTESTVNYNSLEIKGSSNDAHSTVVGSMSATLGKELQTTNMGEVAVGKYNASTANKTQFSVGIGTSDTERKNALEVHNDGKVIFNQEDSKSEPNMTVYSGGSPMTITEYIDDRVSKGTFEIDVDSELSETSTNPVQNAVITNKIIEDELVVSSALNDLNTRVIENAADIATNASNIATNTSNIATNASNIATNTSNITSLSGQIITSADYTASTHTIHLHERNGGDIPCALSFDTSISVNSASTNAPTTKAVWDAIKDIEAGVPTTEGLIRQTEVGSGLQFSTDPNDSSRTTLHFNKGKGLVYDTSANVSGRSVSVGAGNGIVVNNDNVAVKVNTGSGIYVDATNGVSAKVGSGLTTNGGTIIVSAGNGLKTDANGLHVGSGNGITLSADAISVKPSNGIAVDANGVSVKANSGISVTTNGVSVNNGNGLTFNGSGSASTLAVKPSSGITVTANGVGVDNGNTLAFTGNKLDVKLDPNGAITSSTNGLSVSINGASGLTINGDKVAVTAGSGITFDANGRVALDSSVMDLYLKKQGDSGSFYFGGNGSSTANTYTLSANTASKSVSVGNSFSVTNGQTGTSAQTYMTVVPTATTISNKLIVDNAVTSNDCVYLTSCDMGSGLTYNSGSKKVDIDLNAIAGSGLTVNNTTNKLDVNVEVPVPTEVQKASDTVFGIVKIGSGINVSDGVISVTHSEPGATSIKDLEEYNTTESGGCLDLSGIGICNAKHVVAGSVYVTSDERKKENIQSLSYEDYKKADSVSFKSFNFKDDETKRKTYGVIAQRVEEANLGEVIMKDENGMLSVDYISLLILKIASLEHKVQELEGKLGK